MTMSGKGVPRFVHVFNALSMLTAMQAAMDISKRKRGAVRLLFGHHPFSPGIQYILVETVGEPYPGNYDARFRWLRGKAF
jgi:hypothetical protein